MSSPTLLREGQSQPPTILNRLSGIFQAGALVVFLYTSGVPHAIYKQLTQPNPINWLNPFVWRGFIIEGGLPQVLKGGDELSRPLKKEAITPFAKGKILELGAGTGLTLQYYDENKIEKLYLVEPFKGLHKELSNNIKKRGQTFLEKSIIVPYGVEKTNLLKSKFGFEVETFDTIVLVLVLCSIPHGKEHLIYLQSLLKSGGTLILFEHVASEDRLTNTLQKIYNPVWTVLSAGCNVNRHSAHLVQNLGGWKEVQLKVPEGQHAGNLYPTAVGRYVKA